ncbi:MAG: DUF5665 domain-containing protein [Halanaerobiales bacterium]|jgi:hypothetical protein|nr:DUF5665 domain-containing protein [Bacillota bacterium]HOA41503.1 DUF5665 domain-containing protein [Halanaerobiales bacterium]HPZ62268.1 DUF5665 domain-containing protein [Halanaerobiales bacterium]HQD03576.1 DUF5665 domain-containing protein [Halanaerobiales bacterium]
MTEEEKDEIMRKLIEISERIQSINLVEYIELVRSPGRMLVINFISGLARGLGIAIGATVLGALFLIILFDLAQSNIPLIAEFVARIIKIVETYL